MSKDPAALFPQRFDDPPVLDAVIEKYLRNKRLIEGASSAFSVQPVFVWQPVPTYGFDFHQYPFLQFDFGQHAYSKFGYPRMAARVARESAGNTFLWCADIQAGLSGPLYVDLVHYSPMMAKVLADTIAGMMIERKLIPAPR